MSYAGPASFISESSLSGSPLGRALRGASRIQVLTPGKPLTLRVEPTSPHDGFAVEILHGPAKLGYVPRFFNRPVNRLLLDSVPLACEVERFDPQAPPWEAVAVRVRAVQPSRKAHSAA